MDPVRDTSRRGKIYIYKLFKCLIEYNFIIIDWSLEAIFDRQLKNACPVANKSQVLVDLRNAGTDYELKPMTTVQDQVAVYELSKSSTEAMDIRMSWNEDSFEYRMYYYI